MNIKNIPPEVAAVISVAQTIASDIAIDAGIIHAGDLPDVLGAFEIAPDYYYVQHGRCGACSYHDKCKALIYTLTDQSLCEFDPSRFSPRIAIYNH